MAQTRVGFVGAGRMGLPMVERLSAAAADLVVHARDPGRRPDLARLGVRTTDTLAEAAHDRDVVLVCVYDDGQLAQVAGPLAAALPAGGVLASHVTARVGTLPLGLLSFAMTIDAVAEQAPGVEVVDAPVSGTAADIRAGRLTVLLGGAPPARALVASVVSAYADPVLETGGPGSALAVKLVNNLLLAANSQLVAAAVHLGEGLGIEHHRLLDALRHMSGGSAASRHAARDADIDEYAARIAPFLRKDIAVCVEQAAELGVDPGLLLEVARTGMLDLA